MAIESAADRLAFVQEFGEDAALYVGAESWDIKGIFDRDFVEVNGVETTAPMLVCRLYDIYEPSAVRDGFGRGPIADRATSLQVKQDGYNIVEVQEDGTGMATLILEKQ